MLESSVPNTTNATLKPESVVSEMPRRVKKIYSPSRGEIHEHVSFYIVDMCYEVYCEADEKCDKYFGKCGKFKVSTTPF